MRRTGRPAGGRPQGGPPPPLPLRQWGDDWGSGTNRRPFPPLFASPRRARRRRVGLGGTQQTGSRRGLALSLAVIVLAAAVPAWADHKPVTPNADVPQARLPLATVPPVVDGVITEAEWTGAVRNAGLVTLRGGTLTPREGAFWLACDGTRLYIAVRSELPPDGQVLNRAVPSPDRMSLPPLPTTARAGLDPSAPA